MYNGFVILREFKMTITSIVTYYIVTLLIFTDKCFANPLVQNNEEFTIRILHTNDMHARFEQISKLATECTPKESQAGQCYGGFARLATLIRQARSESPTIFLNAGDTYQGTAWYNIYKWKAPSVFLELLAPDAISLGNHEFDDGVDGLIPFIENATYPIVTANLDLSQQPDLAATKLQNSTVIWMNDVKIGVIGYLTPETVILSSTDNVKFKDEVESIRREVQKLKKQGVDILIALGHSGYETDKKIAREVEDIDIVIGGHTNTFLYRGEQPDLEVPEGFYPTEVVQKSGRKVYVVQAYAYTKYLGNFIVSFDAKGEVTHIEGNPILVDASIKEADDVLRVITDMKELLKNATTAMIGKTRVLLDGDSKNCRRKECNLGNLICDALIAYNAEEYVSKDEWTDAAIAVQNSGSIRSSISRARDDVITTGDVMNVLPFNNVIVKASMTGEQILSMLEWSAYHLDNVTSTGNLYGAFLQYSGLQVIYNVSQPANSRVVSVQVQCAACHVPSYSKLEKSGVYKVLVNDFIAGGGDGFEKLENLNLTILSVTTSYVLEQYIKKHSPIYKGVEWRISYVDNKDIKELKAENNLGIIHEPIRVIVFLPLISRLLIN